MATATLNSTCSTTRQSNWHPIEHSAGTSIFVFTGCSLSLVAAASMLYVLLLVPGNLKQVRGRMLITLVVMDVVAAFFKFWQRQSMAATKRQVATVRCFGY